MASSVNRNPCLQRSDWHDLWVVEFPSGISWSRYAAGVEMVHKTVAAFGLAGANARFEPSPRAFGRRHRDVRYPSRARKVREDLVPDLGGGVIHGLTPLRISSSTTGSGLMASGTSRTPPRRCV